MRPQLIVTASGCMFLIAALLAPAASAQPLGTFRWQMQPHCNVVSFLITQYGGVYTLDGTDDQCGAAKAASAIGTAFANLDGTIGLGFNIVLSPSGRSVHVSAQLSLPSASGTWTDSLGNAGTFTLTPGPGAGGTPRPLLQRARSGQTMSGQITVRYPANTSFTLGGGSYTNPLPVTAPQPTLEVLPEGTPSSATCPGIGQATPGRLCIYSYNTQNIGTVLNSGGNDGVNRQFGFSLDIFPTAAASPGFFLANWAYQVP
jgi:hypothetical protein